MVWRGFLQVQMELVWGIVPQISAGTVFLFNCTGTAARRIVSSFFGVERTSLCRHRKRTRHQTPEVLQPPGWPSNHSIAKERILPQRTQFQFPMQPRSTSSTDHRAESLGSTTNLTGGLSPECDHRSAMVFSQVRMKTLSL